MLKAKHIVVIGGAGGIGAATVRAFAGAGAAVMSADINDDMGVAVARQAAELGPGPVLYRHLDVTDANAVNALFDEAAHVLGGLDVLAMIAGVTTQKAAEDFTPEDIERQFAVNCGGTIMTNQAAFRHMRGHGGSIINYSSAAGVGGMERVAAYGAAKAGVIGWTRNAALEWGRYLIRVNVVCPLVMTPMAQDWYATLDAEARDRMEAYYQARVPLGGKVGKVEDAANLNLFLASDLSSFITGQTIAVDGGMTMPR